MHQPVNPEDKDFPKIQKKLLSRLGKPHDLFKVDVKNVYGSSYRINVWCHANKEADRADHTIPVKEMRHSFFCTMTKGGTLRCKPKVEKLYRQTDKQQ